MKKTVSKMINIAIFGSTSEIAYDLIIRLKENRKFNLSLFSRSNRAKKKFSNDGSLCYLKYSEFKITDKYDVIINCIGFGDPKKIINNLGNIYTIQKKYDDLILKYLIKNNATKYIFLSSGSVYGESLSDPNKRNYHQIVDLNNFSDSHEYPLSKLFIEYIHRFNKDLNIIDLRLFNYFSHTQSINSNFLMSEISRSILNNSCLNTNQHNIQRDFIHPDDLYQIIMLFITTKKKINNVFDCYSKAPLFKFDILKTLKNKKLINYKILNTASVNKKYYYPRNFILKSMGYKPKFNSLNAVLHEIDLLLKKFNS